MYEVNRDDQDLVVADNDSIRQRNNSIIIIFIVVVVVQLLCPVFGRNPRHAASKSAGLVLLCGRCHSRNCRSHRYHLLAGLP